MDDLTDTLRTLIARIAVLEGVVVARCGVTLSDLRRFRVAQLAQDDQQCVASCPGCGGTRFFVLHEDTAMETQEPCGLCGGSP